MIWIIFKFPKYHNQLMQYRFLIEIQNFQVQLGNNAVNN